MATDDRDYLSEQMELSADVKAVETKEDFLLVMRKWTPRVKPPLSLGSLLLIGKSNGWI
jgi:hypothetical protein